MVLTLLLLLQELEIKVILVHKGLKDCKVLKDFKEIKVFKV
jgi:hypothetical protein